MKSPNCTLKDNGQTGSLGKTTDGTTAERLESTVLYHGVGKEGQGE